MDMIDLDTLRSVPELANYQKEVRSRIRELEDEHKGLPLPDEARAEYAALKQADEGVGSRVAELNARDAYIRSLDDGNSNRVDHIDDDFFGRARPSLKEQDIFDLTTMRSPWGDPDRASQELFDRARRAIDLASFPGQNRSAMQERVTNLLDSVYDDEGQGRDKVARHLLLTGNPIYRRAFTKVVAAQVNGFNAAVSTEEQRALSAVRALSLGSTGIPVPYVLDPTVLGTSNGSVNPMRAVGSIKQITVDEWRGTTSGAITAAYAAEATESSDNTPTLAQPTVSTEKAQAFVPFSIEAGMDWPSLEAEMGGLLAEAKDDLEADKFLLGSGTNEPFGLETGATNTVNATTGQTFDAEDIYRLENAVPPRYRPRSSFVANRAIYNLVRQFDTAGGAQLWVRIGDGLAHGGALGEGLLGYPTYEASSADASAATGNKFLYLGDMSRFVIVDRIGLQIEIIQHLVSTNHRPTGQRGLYAYWRNGSKLIDANAVRVLLGIA